MLGILFLGLLAWGLKSGSMPSKFTSIERSRQPKLYWFSAVLLGLFAVGLFTAAIDQGL